MSTSLLATPPLVKGNLILGNAFEMGKDPLTFIYESFIKYGSIFRVTALNRKFTVLAGPELEEFMTEKGDQKLLAGSSYKDFVEAITGSERAILSLDGEPHLKLRRILTPAFSPLILINNRVKLIETIKEIVINQAKVGPTHVLPLVQRLVSESLALMLGGEKLNEMHEEITYLLDKSLRMYLLEIYPKFFKYFPSYKNARKNVLNFIAEIGEKKKEEYKEDSTGIDLMFRLYDGLKKYPDLLNEKEINLNAIIPFAAGLDTVANTISFFLYELLKRPSMLIDATQEAANIIDPHKEIGLRDIKAQQTLFCLQMEILRLYPIAGMLKRTAATDFEFKGYLVKKGTDLLLGNACTHKMSQFFPDPEKLIIDRHKPPKSEYRQRAFAPYGLGVHKCIGNRISEVAIMFIVATLLDNFEMEMYPKGWKLKIRQLPTLAPTNDFKIKFTEKK